jgi:biotin transporter BioY
MLLVAMCLPVADSDISGAERFIVAAAGFRMLYYISIATHGTETSYSASRDEGDLLGTR